MIPNRKVCPLGSECERIIDGKLESCMWYIDIKGRNPQTGEHVDKKDCAIAVLPILMVQAYSASEHIATSAESVRNALVGMSRVSDSTNKRLR
jgi:hypothetical protein